MAGSRGGLLGDASMSMVGFAVCAAAIGVPSWALLLLKPWVVSWLAVHWAYGAATCFVAVAAFLSIALHWNVRLERWARSQPSAVDLLVVVLAALSCFMLYRHVGDDVFGRMHVPRGGDVVALRVRAVFQFWYGLWIVVMVYSAKIPWDAARAAFRG